MWYVPPPQNLGLFSRQIGTSSSCICFSVQNAYAVFDLAPRTVALHGAVHWVGRAVRSGPGASRWVQLRDILAEHSVEMDAEGGG